MAFDSDPGVQSVRSRGMAHADDFRSICLALEGTTEVPHFERKAFKVKKIYATLAADGKSGNIMLSPDEQLLAMTLVPDGFIPLPNAWGRKGATMAVFEKLNIRALGTALELAWRHAAVAKARRPKRRATDWPSRRVA
jgi:hypothetical protein